jgi:hypothetical protein
MASQPKHQAQFDELLRAIEAGMVAAGPQDEVSAEFLQPVLASMAVEGTVPPETHMTTELALRSWLGQQISKRQLGSPALRAFNKALSLAIDACITRRGLLRQEGALPLVLLEDAIDALPPSECEGVWVAFETHRDTLAAPLQAFSVREHEKW